MELAIRTLAELHAENLHALPSDQRGIERLTESLGRPWFAWAVCATVAVWISVNGAFSGMHRSVLDRPQFPWLELAVSLGSLLMTILILITQNRQNNTADRRAEVTLQIALVSEQKIAKIIELLQAMREDDPHLPQRDDRQASAMAQATDLRTAADELVRAQEEAIARHDESG